MKKIFAVTLLALATGAIACGPDRVVKENTVERSYSSSAAAPPPPPIVQEQSSRTVEKRSTTTID